MTLLVRNEADILEAQIAFHQAAGVDLFIVTDHASTDGTTEILEHHAARGTVYLIRETGSVFKQSEWVTRMARLAAIDHRADWVINSDADEFWWPSGGDLKEVLAEVPEQDGIVSTLVRPFLPPAQDGPFAEQMIVRLFLSAPINDPSSSFRPNTRLLHRGAPDIVVGSGNTSVSSRLLGPVCGWAPVEVLHFPVRSFAHFERKFLAHAQTVSERRRADHQRVTNAARLGGVRRLYDLIAPDFGGLARGLADDSLAIDTRLRDALRRLDSGSTPVLLFPSRDASANVEYAVDQDVLVDGELVRLWRRLDEATNRVSALESDVVSGGR